MTNEEKIKELFEKYKVSTMIHPVVNENLYDALLDMAAWKEQQIIEKVINWLESIMYYSVNNSGKLTCDFTDFDELVEDFKKTIKYD